MSGKAKSSKGLLQMRAANEYKESKTTKTQKPYDTDDTPRWERRQIQDEDGSRS